jgi:DNA-binding winged helix-turn-helix (wHTH) protein/Flp pilus assembly protein TadD
VKSDIVQLGEVTFDHTTRTLIHIDGRPARLRNKSMEVLICLLDSPNQTASKKDVMNKVWSDVIVTDESLVQCIADIRKIIGKDAKQIIETVPRDGYRINVPPQTTPQKFGPKIAMIIATALTCAAAWVFWPQSDVPFTQPEFPDAVSVATGSPGTDNVASYLEVLKGRVSSNNFSLSESLTAERHFRRAIEMDPNFARAYAELGTLLAVRFENDWTVLAAADKEKSLYYAEKAISLEPNLWLGHYALGRLHSVFADFDAAEVHLKRAMELQPENEDARAYLGIVKNFQGDPDGAIAILEPAVRSHPNPPFWYYFGLGHALFNAGRNDQSEWALKECLNLSANSPYCLRYLIAVYGETGQLAEAEAAGEIYAAMGFDLSVASILKLVTFHHSDDRAQLERALRLAEIPD